MSTSVLVQVVDAIAVFGAVIAAITSIMLIIGFVARFTDGWRVTTGTLAAAVVCAALGLATGTWWPIVVAAVAAVAALGVGVGARAAGAVGRG